MERRREARVPNPRPIRPRVKDARAYDAALRQSYLVPYQQRLVQRLANAESVTQVYRANDAALAELEAMPRAGIPTEVIQENLEQVRNYNRAKLFDTFRRSIGVDVRPFLQEGPISSFMEQRVADNVGLVRTIPQRFHDKLRTRVGETFAASPFDQQALSQVLRQEFKSSGWNLRRLTRDQSQKLNAQLTQVRHGQLGVTRYVWRTSEDERVRETHQAHNGKMYEWANPPPVTGHPGQDVLCRCTAEGVVSDAQRRRLAGGDPEIT